jgi:hypothetical protein
MKKKTTLAAVLLAVTFLMTIVAIEAPRKPKRETVYVLPRVDEMPTIKSNRFSF